MISPIEPCTVGGNQLFVAQLDKFGARKKNAYTLIISNYFHTIPHYHYPVNNFCEDYGSYERLNYNIILKTNLGFPYWDLHN